MSTAFEPLHLDTDDMLLMTKNSGRYVAQVLIRDNGTHGKLVAEHIPYGDLFEAAPELLELIQEALPGGISLHEFNRPGGWLERAQAAAAKATRSIT